MMEKTIDLSVTLLVPLEWVQMNFLDCIQYWRKCHLLPDITPGPFPQYAKGKAQKGNKLMMIERTPVA